MNTSIESSDTTQHLLLSTDLKEPVFRFVVSGAPSKDFVFPNGDIAFEAKKITLENYRDKSRIEITNKSNPISVSELWLYLEEMEDSGTLNYCSIKRVLNAFNLSWIKLILIKEQNFDCDCCGDYSITDFEIENKITNSTMSCSDNTHFYSGDLPNMNELMDFILEVKK